MLEDERLGWLLKEDEFDATYVCDMTFNNVLKMIEKLPEEEIVGMAASNALTNIQFKNR